MKNEIGAGAGSLQVMNGTSLSAIVKLVDVFRDKSVYTVVVGVGSEIKVLGIPDGSYRVLFELGSGWNLDSNELAHVRGCSQFQDPLNFRTRLEYDGTEYTTWKLTLNAVVDGNAKTEQISAQEFSRY